MGFSSDFKGQSSLEMIAGFGLLTMIMIILVLISMNKSSEADELKLYLDAKRVGGKIVDNLETINREGLGYYKYFSIPEYLVGMTEYNVTLRGGVLTLQYEDKAFSRRISNANVSVHSLSKGLDKRNRVKRVEWGLLVTGHKANLVPLIDTFNAVYNPSTGNVTISVYVVNDAHITSNSTTARFTQKYLGTRFKDAGIPELKPYEKAYVNVSDDWLGVNEYSFSVDVDEVDNVTESIESDNYINKSIRVVS